jgi:hypothetical protein
MRFRFEIPPPPPPRCHSWRYVSKEIKERELKGWIERNK